MAQARNGEDATVVRVARLRYWRASDAGVVVDAWRRSGEGQAAFAERHGIEAQRLSRWVTRLEGPSERMRFHPVRLVQAAGAEGVARPIEIVLSEGYTVRVPAGFASEDLERVLGVLGASAKC